MVIQEQDWLMSQKDLELPQLNQLDGVRNELQRRLQQEVDDLGRRIALLRETGSAGSETIIVTYQRMIASKRRFLTDMDL